MLQLGHAPLKQELEVVTAGVEADEAVVVLHVGVGDGVEAVVVVLTGGSGSSSLALDESTRSLLLLLLLL